MEHIIEKYALENALRHKGKASPGAITGSVIREFPNAKKDMEKLNKLIKKIVSEINNMNLEQQETRLKEIAPELLEKEKKEKDIFDVMKVKPGEKIITAFPPEPSKYPHIGHAKSILINYEFAKRNKGKFILRFEDTNPELAEKEFYDVHLNDYKWLGITPDKVEYASDYMNDFYELLIKLIEKKQAYVCDCEQEQIKKSRMKGIPCEHRDQSVDENLKQWKNMETSENIIVRAKIDLKHKNTTMRDPTLFRIIDEEHPRTGKKYRIWPTYDFQNAVMDGLENINYRFRTKEFELRSELQRHLQKILDLPQTRTYEFARFNLEGTEASGRIIREKIEKNELIGWDDPSLSTIAALRRRGFQPKAIKEFVLSTGITKNEATLTWDDIIIHNKRLLDEQSNRYFFIEDPVKVAIENAPEQAIELNLHPEHRKGGRKFKVKNEFYLAEKDFELLKNNKLYRLMECLNFTKEKDKLVFHSLSYEDFKGKGDKIMHFLPVNNNLVNCKVLMPDKKTSKGLAEPLIKQVKENEVIQFERFGFCRLDSKNEFWYTHS